MVILSSRLIDDSISFLTFQTEPKMFDCDDDGMIQVKLPEFSVTRFGDISPFLVKF